MSRTPHHTSASWGKDSADSDDDNDDNNDDDDDDDDDDDFGSSGAVLDWFISYLSCRTQSVFVGHESTPSVLQYGVPQGSVLGPLLFTLYTHSLSTVICQSCIVLYCIVLYCIVLYCIVLYCIVLYCIVLYCIVLKMLQNGWVTAS